VLRRSCFGGLLVVVMLSACASSASAGQIVYRHGSEVWAVNENGTAPHALVDDAQAGVSGIYDPSVDPIGGTVAFVGTTLAPDGNCEINCDGLYVLAGGALTRLSGPPANCITAGTECDTAAENPSVTTNGRVVYLAETVFGSIDFDDVATTTIDDLPLNGSEAPAPWGLPPQSVAKGDDDPSLFYTVASDPANPNLIAYEGGTNCSVGMGVSDTGCITGIVVDDNQGQSPYNVSYDDEGQDWLAFSPNGNYVADIEAGEQRGIWIYTDEDVENAANDGTWRGWYVLEDPDQDSNDGGDPDQHTFQGVTVTGSGAIVFDDGTNIFSVPASCWGPSNPDGFSNSAPTPTKADCGAFSTTNPTANPNVTQLTTDGTGAALDTLPAWTAATVAAFASGSAAGGSPSGGSHGPQPPPPAPAPAIQLLTLARAAITSAGGVTFDVKLNAPATIVVKISELPGGAGTASAKGKRKGPKLIGTITFAGKAGLNVLKIKRVRGHLLAPGRYIATVTVRGAAAGTRPRTLNFTVRRRK
jgi:hypothetical protein